MMRSPLSRCGNKSLMTESTGATGGHQHHDRARFAKQRDEINDVLRAADIAFGRFLPQRLDLGRVLVVARHRKAVVGHVQHEIAPHDAQADHADFRLLCLFVC